jgi:hypothetical protein
MVSFLKMLPFVVFATVSENEEVDLLYDLDEIYEDYKQPFHADDYPNITDRYFRISSIEGESSYFYDHNIHKMLYWD